MYSHILYDLYACIRCKNGRCYLKKGSRERLLYKTEKENHPTCAQHLYLLTQGMYNVLFHLVLLLYSFLKIHHTDILTYLVNVQCAPFHWVLKTWSTFFLCTKLSTRTTYSLHRECNKYSYWVLRPFWVLLFLIKKNPVNILTQLYIYI